MSSAGTNIELPGERGASVKRAFISHDLLTMIVGVQDNPTQLARPYDHTTHTVAGCHASPAWLWFASGGGNHVWVAGLFFAPTGTQMSACEATPTGGGGKTYDDDDDDGDGADDDDDKGDDNDGDDAAGDEKDDDDDDDGNDDGDDKDDDGDDADDEGNDMTSSVQHHGSQPIDHDAALPASSAACFAASPAWQAASFVSTNAEKQAAHSAKPGTRC